MAWRLGARKTGKEEDSGATRRLCVRVLTTVPTILFVVGRDKRRGSLCGVLEVSVGQSVRAGRSFLCLCVGPFVVHLPTTVSHAMKRRNLTHRQTHTCNNTHTASTSPFSKATAARDADKRRKHPLLSIPLPPTIERDRDSQTLRTFPEEQRGGGEGEKKWQIMPIHNYKTLNTGWGDCVKKLPPPQKKITNFRSLRSSEV